LKGSEDLVVAWRPTAVGQEPRDEEHALIEQFKVLHGGRRPFANRQD
jgi:hypothetical protein